MAELLLDKVLVTTDLSVESEAAIEAVKPLCEQFSANITLLHVTEFAPESYEGLVSGDRQREHAYRLAVKRLLLEQLEAMRRRHFDDRWKARVALIDGRPVWKAICSYAAQHGYQLIVIATHGRHGVRRALLGSVAEQVSRNAHCPVMTARPSDAPSPTEA